MPGETTIDAGLYCLSVGPADAGLPGFTNVQMQAAVDRLAALGGGVVRLGAGTYRMADSVHLKNGVRLRGTGADTVLVKDPMRGSPVKAYLGFGHDDLLVPDPNLFRHGDGILLSDDGGGGFLETTATLVRRAGDVWYFNRPLAYDCRPDCNGRVRTLYSLVSIVDAADVEVSDLAIAGNAAANDRLNGCRGGGVFAHRSQRLAVRRVGVSDFNGDGISFQTCDDLELDGCTVSGCTGMGFHPGSGSNRFHIHDCTARDNGGDGLFYCVRARCGRLEDCAFVGNAGNGVSIGCRDTDSVNRRLEIRENGRCGIVLRERPEPDAPHRTTVEDCRLTHNCRLGDPEDAEIRLTGAVHDVVLRANHIVRRPPAVGIAVGPEIAGLVETDNRLEPAGDSARIDHRQTTETSR